MLNFERLKLELSNKDYFMCNGSYDGFYIQMAEEHGLDPMEQYDAANDHINLLEAAYSILSMLSNDIDSFRKVETEFATTSAAYQCLQKRMKDVRTEIDRLKCENNTASSIVHHLFFNA